MIYFLACAYEMPTPIILLLSYYRTNVSSRTLCLSISAIIGRFNLDEFNFFTILKLKD